MTRLFPSRTTTGRRPADRSIAALPLALALAVGGLAGCSEAENAASDAASTATSAAESALPDESTSSASESGDDSSPETIVATETDFAIALSEDELTAGTYEIEVVSDGDAPHNLIIVGPSGDSSGTQTIEPGGTATLPVTLEPGEYVFYCSIGNHRAMGMELTVTVT